MESVNAAPRNWTPTARWLHWLMALAILIEAPAGYIMGRTYGAKGGAVAAWHFATANIHHTLGLVILGLALARLGWRATHRPPPVEGSGVERAGARISHWLLYILLFLIPLSGWAALSSLADSPAYGHTVLWFFGSDGFGPHGVVPHIVPPRAYDDKSTPWTYGTFGRAHFWLLIVGAVLVTIHILAALRHHYLLKDSTLSRMAGTDE